MRTTYLLDTSVLVSDPLSFKQFSDCDVILPITVLNELDKVKKFGNEAGKNARVAIRMIDEVSNLGDISVGVLLENNSLIKVDATYYNTNLPEYAGFGDPSYGDTQILACLYVNFLAHTENNVTLVSNDINLRIKAKSRGIEAIEYKGDKVKYTDLYAGIKTICNEEAALELQASGAIDPSIYGLDLYLNEFAILTAEDGTVISMGRKVSEDKFKMVKRQSPWNISPRNKEQSCAIDLIMDPELDLVTLIGGAGTGKSLVALASAMELVINKRAYDKLIIYRPMESVGKEMGFLPGLAEEKLAPWFQAIMDSFEVLLSNKSNRVKGTWKLDLEMFKKKGQIEMDALTFIRGRSLPRALIMFDEAQQITKEEIKTLLTRCGTGSKFIITGDLEQIDNKDLDATNNGLTYLIDKFKGKDLAGHITLTKGERSRLATLASEIL